eukprot:CAMPEP_0172944180 /NCGR_PEP_ID=MMETSP1075-20121228/225920_1 /TAXON_ID=2916 /ORGANISM="Ceratium fusus, Strain PA161109" /LENGTH=58 /DNA_ID=CAMNT_0013805607 /DNA_START=669 /DNA_END=845 /DNA_ORIENTATION=-
MRVRQHGRGTQNAKEVNAPHGEECLISVTLSLADKLVVQHVDKSCENGQECAGCDSGS